MESNTKRLVKNEDDRKIINEQFRSGNFGGDDDEDEGNKATGVAGFLHQVMALFRNKIQNVL